MELTQAEKNVYLLKWDGEGRFNLGFIAQFNDALDKVLSDPHACCLITMGSGKIYSNGLDLFTILDPSKNRGVAPHKFLTDQYFPLLTRLLTLPILTISAIQGHAYAGGMILALAHDHAIMQAEKGYLCMNEVLMPATLPPGMAEIVMGRIRDFSIRRDCMLHARRFSGQEARELGIIDQTCPADSLLETAIKIAREKSKTFKKREIVSSIKEKLHSRAIAALKIPEPAETFAHFVVSKI